MRWPKNQKNTSVRMTKIEVGGLAMGQVARRHRSPSRTSDRDGKQLGEPRLAGRVDEHREDAQAHEQGRRGDVEVADTEPAIPLARLGKRQREASGHGHEPYRCES